MYGTGSMHGYNLSLKETNFGGEVNILDSQDIRFVRGGVTIDAATVTAIDIDGKMRKIVYAGTPIGKITASGKFGPYAAAATDGRATAKYVLGSTIDCTDGDMVTTAYDRARLIEARLPVTYTPTMKTQLKNIDFV